jgi:hypothetical protein
MPKAPTLAIPSFTDFALSEQEIVELQCLLWQSLKRKDGLDELVKIESSCDNDQNPSFDELQLEQKISNFHGQEYVNGAQKVTNTKSRNLSCNTRDRRNQHYADSFSQKKIFFGFLHERTKSDAENARTERTKVARSAFRKIADEVLT